MPDTLHNLGGIDEAGLGPVLGPLVVGSVVLEGPAGEDPWKLLGNSTCKKPRRTGSKKLGGDRRIRVNDSKLVHTGPQGKAELERTALVFLSESLGKTPETLQELLAQSLNFDGLELERYPWYQDLDQVPLPRWADPLEVQFHRIRLRKDLEDHGGRLLHSGFQLILVGAFNRLIQKTNNKSLTLYYATEGVLIAALRAAREGKATRSLIVLDRQGGRAHYARLLARSFPKAKVQVLDEAGGRSLYSLGQGFDLLFAEKGDQLSFPTAAASCIAKYLRELLVERINAYFLASRPGLKPTAGYFQDGRRFLKDLGPLIQNIPSEILIRLR
ncbi:MAG TPA: hypothetical protein ENK02_07050 [Planctomycetes bacterium]|nr:hypothetical protein [Planctomycetota bacterium]